MKNINIFIFFATVLEYVVVVHQFVRPHEPTLIQVVDSFVVTALLFRIFYRRAARRNSTIILATGSTVKYLAAP